VDNIRDYSCFASANVVASRPTIDGLASETSEGSRIRLVVCEENHMRRGASQQGDRRRREKQTPPPVCLPRSAIFYSITVTDNYGVKSVNEQKKCENVNNQCFSFTISTSV